MAEIEERRNRVTFVDVVVINYCLCRFKWSSDCGHFVYLFLCFLDKVNDVQVSCDAAQLVLYDVIRNLYNDTCLL